MTDKPTKTMQLKLVVRYIILQMILFAMIGFGSVAAFVFYMKISSATSTIQHQLEHVSAKDLKSTDRG